MRINAQSVICSAALYTPLLGTYYLQLASTSVTRNLDDQLAKLATLLHIVKQAVDAIQVVNALDHPADDGLDLMGVDKVYHILELLSRTHGRTSDVDVLEDSGHGEGHLGPDCHAVDGDDATRLLSVRHILEHEK